MEFDESINENVNEYIKQLDSPLKPLFIDIRKTILKACPDFKEDIKWKNCLTYSTKKNAIQTVVGKEQITLIFFEGVSLNDPKSLLFGDGKKARSYRITEQHFDESGLRDLATQAMELSN
ncbi:DUF1801 domain-containing protein [Fulvivirgaceae bacterium BMA10]|uniref:DUF1801 domain-containing protein n=1 Tax=Splendidivirga corallicola TaxID=3051826 RepID=A0ABT8KVQ9_9BACT|nr:DUF1801 domain-containing protein [Fulvivirgaceae bacterium BMA10]